MLKDIEEPQWLSSIAIWNMLRYSGRIIHAQGMENTYSSKVKCRVVEYVVDLVFNGRLLVEQLLKTPSTNVSVKYRTGIVGKKADTSRDRCSDNTPVDVTICWKS